MTNWYVWAGDLNSLYDEKPRAGVVVEKCSSEKEAKACAASISDHQTAAWVRTYNCEDENHTWDSDDPLLSVRYKHTE